MELKKEMLMKAAPLTNKDRLDDFIKTFNEWNNRFGINTPLRVAHFLATVWHESGALRFVEENLNYSESGLRKVFPRYFPTAALAARYARRPQAIANRVYANRMGNGNEASGDGWRFKGRGLIQITGRANYLAYQQSGFCNGDLMSHTEWLTRSPGMTKSAMWFWYANGCNALADSDDATAVCRRVNGGLNGLQERKVYLNRFKAVIK